MKHLEYYIIEALSTNRKQLIDYLSDENNKIREKDIDRAFNVVTNLSDDLYNDLISNVFSKNSESFKALMNSIEHQHTKNDFIKLLNEKNNFPTYNDLLNNDNIYNLIEKSLKRKLSEIEHNIIHNILCISTKDKNQKGIGKGEILLNLFIQKAGNSKKSDVLIDGHEIEVKVGNSKYESGGRIKGNDDTIKSPKEIENNIISELKKYDINLDKLLITGPDKTKKVIKDILDTNKININELFKIYSKAYYYQFFSSENENVNKYIDKISSNVTLENFGKTLISNIHAPFAIIAYSNHWDNLIVINSDNGDYYILDKSKITLELDNINEVNDLLNKEFVFKNGPSNTDGSNQQSYVSTIFVKNR